MREPIYITWLNNLGGFEYALFTDFKDFSIDIEESVQIDTNIFPNWPNSYGQYADTIRKDVSRTARNMILFRAGSLSKERADFLASIKTSVLVQILKSKEDRRTILIDADSFIVRSDADKLHAISFSASYTDTIPTQTA